MVWIVLFRIMTCEIQMMILRVHVPTLHLALVWERHDLMFDYPSSSRPKQRSQGLEVQSIFPWRISKARSGGQKWRWKQTQKWTGMRKDRKVSGLFVVLECSGTLLLEHTQEVSTQVDCLIGSRLTLDNSSFFGWR